MAAPTGPAKGMSERASAAEAPMIASGAGSLIISIDRVVMITWTSLR